MAEATLPASGVGELTALLLSWRLHLEASNLSPRTIRAYTDDGALLAAFLATKGMPTDVVSIRREHVEAFIVAELKRTSPASAATRYHSLQQLINWLDEESGIDASPMAKVRSPRSQRSPCLCSAPLRPSGTGESVRSSGRSWIRACASMA